MLAATHTKTKSAARTPERMAVRKQYKAYGRRAFLGGASVAIGLPFLETLAPQHALGQSTAAPKRFVGYLAPNGMVMNHWRPSTVGADFELGAAMGPDGRVFNDGLPELPVGEMGPGLDQLKSDILILSGLQNTQQEPGPGDHAGGCGSFLTNRTVPKAVDALMGGPSIDYVISQALGQETRRPYLIMSGEQARPAGSTCDSGYSCGVSDHISFDEAGRNLTRLDNPGDAFDALFEGYEPPDDDGMASANRWATAQSILDAVQEETQGLVPTLSVVDRPRLEEYLESIREVERRIANLSNINITCEVPESRPTAYSFTNGRYDIDVAHSLMALALQCDITRVVSFMWGNSSNGRPHNFIFAPGGHHDISHHGGDAEQLGKLARIDYWWFRRFASFLSTLKQLPDIDGRPVLDNTIVFQSSDISDGDEHNHDDMPVLLAGGGAGFSMGRHVEYNGNWFGELFVSIARGMGVNIDTFGEHGTGPLPGLSV
jgi:hypothetical protein